MSRFIQTHYDNKQPDNYYNYIDHPILPLERALAPVVSHIDQLDHNIDIAKRLCRNFSLYKLTDDESAAVYLYTNEWSKQSLHHVLNRVLNSGSYTLIRPWFGFLKLLITALQNLPSVKSRIWRGMHINIVKYYQENEEITWWNFSSCSYSVSVIRSFFDENSILCSIDALHGKKVRDFAYNTTEDEIMLMPGTHLCVKSNTLDRSTGKRIIHLEEISNDSSKTPTSTSKSVSPSIKLSKHELRPDNALASYASTTYIMVNDPLSNEYESKNDKVFSATTFENGDRYEVPYKNGKKQGYGVYFYSDGRIEEGYLADLRAKGKGICTWTNGDRYDGTFRDGKMSGYGSLFYANGCVFTGNWIAGEAYGSGSSMWPNGNHYEGSHKNGKMHGYGTLCSTNEDKYQGDLVDEKAHGQGVRIWKNGDRYDGDFKDDKKHGYGVYSYIGGSKYRGNWAYDEMNGQGTFTWPSGTRYEGTFRNGKRHGQGKLTFHNGQIQNGLWENDRYIS